MKNKPTYNFFKNTSYAIKGLKELIKNETSFKIELVLVTFLIPIIIFVDVLIVNKILMFVTLFFILIAEAINSAIERVVDLVTQEYHELAGQAKDIGSAIVFLSIVTFLITWGLILTADS
ncbi:MAG: diacylglycerol kinase [Sulfurimonas sp.]|nr:MAG: diacylglycerol kinase [Sulfurimonas sp.]